MTKNHTSLRIKDLKEAIDKMCPIQIYINEEKVWDDDENTLNDYNTILSLGKFVSSINFEIVHFHHSVVYVRTVPCI